MASKPLDMFQELIDDDTEKSPKALRTISEVSDLLDVPQHVLRFWETKFPQIKPMKRAGGRRFYRPEDVAILKQVKHLLYSQGFTIKGAKKAFEDQKFKNDNVKKKIAVARPAHEEVIEASTPAPVITEAPKAPVAANTARAVRSVDRKTLVGIRDELKALRDMLVIRKAIQS